MCVCVPTVNPLIRLQQVEKRARQLLDKVYIHTIIHRFPLLPSHLSLSQRLKKLEKISSDLQSSVEASISDLSSANSAFRASLKSAP